MRYIGKDASRKMQPADALLVNGMGTHFHKCMRTSFTRHFSEQGIQFYGIRGGMRGGPGADR